MKCPVCGEETPLDNGRCRQCRADLGAYIGIEKTTPPLTGPAKQKFGERLGELLWRVGLPGGVLLLCAGIVWLIVGLSLGYLFSQAVVTLVLGLAAAIGGAIERLAYNQRVKAADAAVAGGKIEEVKALCPKCERVFVARFGGGQVLARCPDCRKKFRRSQITAAD